MEQSELEEIMRLVILSVRVCLSVCLIVYTSLGGNMHFYERLLVIRKSTFNTCT